jgi:serine/threonine protein kinase
MSELSTPQKLGRYLVAEPFAGEKGSFYALDGQKEWPDCLCVVKILQTEDPPPQKRVAVTRGTSHKGLVAVLRSEQHGDDVLLIKEFVAGLPLEAVFDRKTAQFLPVELALFVAEELSRSLGYLHALGQPVAVHGGVAPTLIYLCFDGRVKLGGVENAGVPEIVQQYLLKKPPSAYRAPESLDGQGRVSAVSDIFSVGAVLWALLTGRSFPPTGCSNAERRKKVLRDFEPPSARRRGLDPALDEIVLSACHPEETKRPESVLSLGKRLADLAGDARWNTKKLAAWIAENHPEAKARETQRRQEMRRLWKQTFDVPATARTEHIAHNEKKKVAAKQTKAEKVVHRDGDGGKQGGAENAVSEKHVDPDTPPAPGSLVGMVLDKRYRIDQLLGEGGMGEVYAAEHIQIGRKVAIKVLHYLYSNEQEVLERFRREARAATAIGHPNIVEVTDSGTTPDGRAFFVMEQLNGMELADVIIEQRWLDPVRAVHIAAQVCQAVGAAHEAGIIHRDLKPENVFLVSRGRDPDFVKILDFGIAKNARMEMTRGGGLTQPGLAMGTPEYMAPEQAAGKPADARVDVYATGGLLYAMLAGRPPHQGANVMEVLTRKATKDPLALRKIRAEISEELEHVCMRALAKNPDDRPQSMEQLYYELKKIQAGRGAAVAAVLGIDPADSAQAGVALARSATPSGEAAALRDSGDWQMEGVSRDAEPAQRRTSPRAETAPAETGAANERAEVAAVAASAAADDPGTQPFVLGAREREELAASFESGTDVLGTVVRRPSRGFGWLWVLLIFVGIAGLAVGLFFMKKRSGEKQARTQTTASFSEDGSVDDAAVPLDGAVADAQPVDGSAKWLDAASPDAAPPQLSEAEVDGLVSKGWKAARRGRWTKPAGSSLLGVLEKLETADSVESKKQVKALKKYARRKLFRKARRYTRRKTLLKAEKVLRDLVALLPGDTTVKKRLVRVLTRRADKALQKKKYQRAEALAGEAVTLDGSDGRARYSWARALEKTGKKQVALVQYKKLVKDRSHKASIRRKAKAASRRLEKELGEKNGARPSK